MIDWNIRHRLTPNSDTLLIPSIDDIDMSDIRGLKGTDIHQENNLGLELNKRKTGGYKNMQEKSGETTHKVKII